MEYATSRVANHRYLSVNGHEVQRRVAGLRERFMAENRSHYSSVLGELVDSLTTDPLCLTHNEIDIHWSLLTFLLDVSKDPVRGLPKGIHELQSIDDGDVDAADDKLVMDDLLTSLTECNINVPKLQEEYNESDLSVCYEKSGKNRAIFDGLNNFYCIFVRLRIGPITLPNCLRINHAKYWSQLRIFQAMILVSAQLNHHKNHRHI